MRSEISPKIDEASSGSAPHRHAHLHPVTDDGSKDVFLHATALERAGIRNLVEGQKVSFDTEPDRRTGKAAATDLRAD